MREAPKWGWGFNKEGADERRAALSSWWHNTPARLDKCDSENASILSEIRALNSKMGASSTTGNDGQDIEQWSKDIQSTFGR